MFIFYVLNIVVSWVIYLLSFEMSVLYGWPMILSAIFCSYDCYSNAIVVLSLPILVKNSKIKMKASKMMWLWSGISIMFSHSIVAPFLLLVLGLCLISCSRVNVKLGLSNMVMEQARELLLEFCLCAPNK